MPNDEMSFQDTDEQPADVGEYCRNCGKGIHAHKGWACKEDSRFRRRSQLDPEYRYMSGRHLRATYTPPKPEPPKAKDLTDWRSWKTPPAADECACGGGMKRALCTYHKG